MKVIRIAMFFSLITFSFNAVGQTYDHSLGVRAGYSSGITYKGFLRYRMTAIEADVLYNRHGFNLTGLYEHHIEPVNHQRWFIYIGGGVFGGTWEGKPSAGITAVAGIEYTVRDMPLNFCMDWKPMMNAYQLYELDLVDFGVSIRYRFSL